MEEGLGAVCCLERGFGSEEAEVGEGGFFRFV